MCIFKTALKLKRLNQIFTAEKTQIKDKHVDKRQDKYCNLTYL